jgi:hypothetical protein
MGDEHMGHENIIRKDLDNEQFMRLRQNTKSIMQLLDKRLKSQLKTLRPLFTPQKLLGTYIKSANPDEVSGSDKAFAELQAKFGASCEKPFELPKKLQTPLPPVSSQLDAIPFKYNLYPQDDQKTTTTITAATRWIISYRSECPYDRLKAMLSGDENRQPDDMRQALLAQLILVVFLERFPALVQLLRDLRYDVEIKELDDLGGLPVVVLAAPLESFLPSDDFILQVTQLSGIPAFEEIIDEDAVDRIQDVLKDKLKATVGS